MKVFTKSLISVGVLVAANVKRDVQTYVDSLEISELSRYSSIRHDSCLNYVIRLLQNKMHNPFT